MAVYRLAVVIKKPCSASSSLPPSDGEEFLVVRQTSPLPKLAGEEYRGYLDSDLWDLPSAQLKPLDEGATSELVVEGPDFISDKLDLRKFDIGSALSQVLSQVGLVPATTNHWVHWKFVEEAEFGPDTLVHTVFILGKLKTEEENLQELSKWISIQSAIKLLLEVKPSDDRIGPLVAVGLLSDSVMTSKWKVPPTLLFQEYPPGIRVLPMRSRTAKPFRTTNLVILAPDNVTNDSEDSGFIAYGDALLMDPGCCSEYHLELADVVAALPRKLVVFVTHHHYDHVDGGEEICIGGQCLQVIFAPGHTDGHVALLHVSTNSLVVGDHCVGQGSAVLDVKAGGNMKDYFQTTYRFLELSPHVLIPMHGRTNLWPKRMLCGYLKHRRDREFSILKAIESGAETLFDIVAKSYADVNVKLWLPASSNVRIHVDHLAYQGKLPEEFSVEKFRATCELHFLSRWLWVCLKGAASLKPQKSFTVKLLVVVAVAIAGLAVVCTF